MPRLRVTPLLSVLIAALTFTAVVPATAQAEPADPPSTDAPRIAAGTPAADVSTVAPAVAAAQRAKDDRQADVNRLTAQVDSQRADVDRLGAVAERATENSQRAADAAAEADAAASAARDGADAARGDVDNARSHLRRLLAVVDPTTSVDDLADTVGLGTGMTAGPSRLPLGITVAYQGLVAAESTLADQARDQAEAQAVVDARRSVADATDRVRDDAVARVTGARDELADLGNQVGAAKDELDEATRALDVAENGPPPVAPLSVPGWSPEKGQAVVDAAQGWLGTPYAWGGGTPEGPTEGIPPDVGVIGFDCSGLTQWSWAQFGILVPKFAASQFDTGWHPSPAELMPGDLLFWSNNGMVNGIHHVALFLGAGTMVEAPQSGDVVKVSPVRFNWEYFGATRPGT